jgi:hypothetical protein
MIAPWKDTVLNTDGGWTPMKSVVGRCSLYGGGSSFFLKIRSDQKVSFWMQQDKIKQRSYQSVCEGFESLNLMSDICGFYGEYVASCN